MKQALKTASGENGRAEQKVLHFASNHPGLGQAAVVSRLKQEGTQISPSAFVISGKSMDWKLLQND